MEISTDIIPEHRLTELEKIKKSGIRIGENRTKIDIRNMGKKVKNPKQIDLFPHIPSVDTKPDPLDDPISTPEPPESAPTVPKESDQGSGRAK